MHSGNLKVLFLCLENLDHSRFSEIYFNHLAGHAHINWQSFSRIFKVGKTDFENSYIIALERLEKLGIKSFSPLRNPYEVTVDDLRQSDLRVALYQPKNLKRFCDRFPDWLDQIEFWQIPDTEKVELKQTFITLENQIEKLINRLALLNV